MRARPGRLVFGCLLVGTILTAEVLSASPAAAPSGSYADLLQLFDDWRAFEKPPLRGTGEGAAHDFTAATVARRHAELAGYRARLAAIDTSGWSVEQRSISSSCAPR
jgi:hypothetical protein